MNNATPNGADKQVPKFNYPVLSGPIRDIAGERVHQKGRLEIPLILWASTEVDLRKSAGNDSAALNNLLMQLCVCANEYDEGYFAYAGFRDLGKRTGVKSMSTIQNHIYGLWRLQLISIYRRKGKGRAGSFLYEIHKGAKPAPRANCSAIRNTNCSESRNAKAPKCSEVANIKRAKLRERELKLTRELPEASLTLEEISDQGETKKGEILSGSKTTPAPKPPPPSNEVARCISKWESRSRNTYYRRGWKPDFADSRTIAEVETIVSLCGADEGMPWPSLLTYLYSAEPEPLWADKNSLMRFPSPGEVIKHWDSIVERRETHRRTYKET